jgi:hypothetical protein
MAALPAIWLPSPFIRLFARLSMPEGVVPLDARRATRYTRFVILK